MINSEQFTTDVLVRMINEVDIIKNQTAQIHTMLLEQSNNPETHSKERNELFGALSKAQGEYERVRHDKVNKFTKSSYSSIHGMLKAVQPILAQHGLAFYYEKKVDALGCEMLWAILGHTSGQWTSSQFRILPTKNDPHSQGSALSFAMRHAVKSLLGIGIQDDPDDDDAEEVMEEHRFEDNRGTNLNDEYRNTATTVTVTKNQIEELEYELQGYPDLALKIRETYRLNSIADLPQHLYRDVITRLREVKKARSGN